MVRPSLRAEQRLWKAGYQVVAGVDEVGRGAWAGPIVAAAVAVSYHEVAKFKHEGWFGLVADSKKLTPAVRELIFTAATPHLTWATGIVQPKQIDAYGIGVANRHAIEFAVGGLKIRPNFVLVDYVARLGSAVSGVPAKVLVRGDAKVFCIALASVIAKVTRDRLMVGYAERYSGYGFAKHKGYGTAEHTRALRCLGPSPLHRLTYRPVAKSAVRFA